MRFYIFVVFFIVQVIWKCLQTHRCVNFDWQNNIIFSTHFTFIECINAKFLQYLYCWNWLFVALSAVFQHHLCVEIPNPHFKNAPNVCSTVKYYLLPSMQLQQRNCWKKNDKLNENTHRKFKSHWINWLKLSFFYL